MFAGLVGNVFAYPCIFITCYQVVECSYRKSRFLHGNTFAIKKAPEGAFSKELAVFLAVRIAYCAPTVALMAAMNFSLWAILLTDASSPWRADAKRIKRSMRRVSCLFHRTVKETTLLLSTHTLLGFKNIKSPKANLGKPTWPVASRPVNWTNNGVPFCSQLLFSIASQKIEQVDQVNPL